MQHSFQLSDYPVFIASLEDTLPAWLQNQRYSQFILVTDDNIREQCLPVFLQKSGLPSSIPLIQIPSGESHKNLAACELIWQAMVEARLDRNALVINLGGGVVGDMGGFCAATFKRGVDFIQVPTTLLAMTDASIGGKLGIDFQGIKNTVGVFRNPAAVFSDPAFLHTLPPRELRSGFAEVIKHALIGDPVLWANIQTLQANRLSPHGVNWFDILYASIAVKVRIVAEDPLEKGLRALLNFGHTIGHAIESYFLNTDTPLTHGEAVAIGMICETQARSSLGETLPRPSPKREGDEEDTTTPSLLGEGRGGVSPREDRNEISSIILGHFSHHPIPETAFPALWDLMLQDKKNASGTVRTAVPDAEPFSMHLGALTRTDMEQSLAHYNGLAQQA